MGECQWTPTNFGSFCKGFISSSLPSGYSTCTLESIYFTHITCGHSHTYRPHVHIWCTQIEAPLKATPVGLFHPRLIDSEGKKCRRWHLSFSSKFVGQYFTIFSRLTTLKARSHSHILPTKTSLLRILSV